MTCLLSEHLLWILLPASLVVRVALPVPSNSAKLFLPTAATEYRIPASRLPIVTELLVVDPVLVGTPLQVVPVNVTVYTSTDKLLVGWEKDRVADVAVTDDVITVGTNTSVKKHMKTGNVDF